MLAFTNTTHTKAAVLAQIIAHREADQIVKGQYWEDGKGCAVGCTIHSSNYAEYEPRFGIPQMLACLEDCIFEGLPNGEAVSWPWRFIAAVPEGADLSCVGWQFLHWLLTDPTINPGIEHKAVRDAVKHCADVIAPLAKGKPSNKSAALSVEEAAAVAAVTAWSMESAAWSARSAWSAARSARPEASSVQSARLAVKAVRWSARSAARSAAESVRSAAEPKSATAAMAEAWRRMADKLLELIAAAPVPGAPS